MILKFVRILSLLILPLVFGIGAAVPSAWAELGGGIIELEVRLPDGSGDFTATNATEIENFFGSARCDCSSSGTANQSFGIRLTLSGVAAVASQPIEVWVGNGCDTADDTLRAQNCEQLSSINSDDLSSMPTVVIPTHTFMYPGDSCQETEGVSGVYTLVDADGNGEYEETFNIDISFDTQPPPLAENISVAPGESSALISWDLPTTNTTDIAFFQALCATSGSAVSRINPPTAQYDTTEQLCTVTTTIPISGNSAGTLPAGLAELQPAFLCGETSGASTSLRISSLANETEYDIVLVSVDDAGNFAAIDLGQVTPTPVKDFWELYQQNGGEAEGGFCLTVQTFGDDHPFTTTMRNFRDTWLLPYSIGQWLTHGYYETSSIWQRTFGSTGSFAWLAIVLLLPLVVVSFVWTNPLIVLLIGGMYWRYKQKVPQRLGPSNIYALVTAVVCITMTPALGYGAIKKATVLSESEMGRAYGGQSPFVLPFGQAAIVVDTDVVGTVSLTRTTPSDHVDDDDDDNEHQTGSGSEMENETQTEPEIETDADSGTEMETDADSGTEMETETESEVTSLETGETGETEATDQRDAKQLQEEAPLPTDAYWNNFGEGNLNFSEIVRPRWNLGFRMGPYYPEVDQDGNNTFSTIFLDNKFLLGAFSLDYYFAFPLGQLGLSGSIGITGDSAKALQEDGSGGILTNANGSPIRSAEETRFRLLPASLSLVYRFTWFHDRWGIPLVPYGKVGLSYYTWWSTSPGGSVSEVPNAGCPDLSAGTCDGNRAIGASFGYQMTAGISLRIEGIDRGAKVALANQFGIQHAGFFAEYTVARVDGFGNAKKLSVGDSTWSAGINFEF